MRVHVHDPEEQRERLGKPAAASLACHAGLFALILIWSVVSPPAFQFGDPEGDAGGPVTVNLVNGIPLDVPRTRPNPVANPVEHEVPAPRERVQTAAPEPAPPEEPDAPPVETPKRKTDPVRQERSQQQRSEEEPEPNQVASTTGRQASNPIFSGSQQDSAGVGLQGSNPFGQGFGWYATALQRRLSEEWAKTLGQSSGTAAKPAVVRFRILRGGRIDNIDVVEPSGNRSIDLSAERAVRNINPFQPLPIQLRRPYIVVEMWFRLSS